MSSHPVPAHAAQGEAKPHAAHPKPRTYVMVFVWLTILTAIEVVVAAVPMPEFVKIGILVGIAVIKAALVILYYMHLRYDSFWYWIILLVPLFFVMLLTRYLIIR
jgi:cytochrome c oxidase subunit IV